MWDFSGFGQIVQCLAAVELTAPRGAKIDYAEVARRRGYGIAEREFKSAQGAITGGNGFLTSEPLATNIFGSIPRASIAGEIIAASRPLPRFFDRFLVTDTADLAAEVVGEGEAIPVAGTSAQSIIVTPAKVGIIVPYSAELLADPSGPAVIESDFRIVLQRGLDAALLAAVPPDSSTSFSASAAPMPDMKALLRGLGDLSGVAPPILAASPDTLITISTARDAGGQLWPEAGLAGGHMLGCPLFPCDTLNDGVLRALNGEVLAARFGPIQIDAARHASVQMDTAPGQDAATGSGSTMVSGWQSDVVFVRFVVSYAAVALRQGTSASELVGIDW